MRWLPFVYYRLPRSTAPWMAHYCETELLARAAAHVLHRRLRATTACPDEEIRRAILSVLVALLQRGGRAGRAEAEEEGATEEKCSSDVLSRGGSCMTISAAAVEQFWAQEITRAMQHCFPGLPLPFAVDAVSPCLLMERVQELCGVVLSKESMASLTLCSRCASHGRAGEEENTETRAVPGMMFVEVCAMQPRVKVSPVSPLPTPSATTRARRRALLSSLLLFWISRNPHNVDVDDAYAELQPRYLVSASSLDA